MKLIIMFGILFVVWLLLHALTERAYNRKEKEE